MNVTNFGSVYVTNKRYLGTKFTNYIQLDLHDFILKMIFITCTFIKILQMNHALVSFSKNKTPTNILWCIK